MSQMDTALLNEAIVLMRGMGFSWRVIGETFGISSERAQEICKASGLKMEREDDRLYILLSEANKSMGGTCGGAVVRTYNILRRENCVDVESLGNISLVDVAKMRNAGVKTVALCAVAKEIIKRDLSSAEKGL